MDNKMIEILSSIQIELDEIKRMVNDNSEILNSLECNRSMTNNQYKRNSINENSKVSQMYRDNITDISNLSRYS